MILHFIIGSDVKNTLILSGSGFPYSVTYIVLQNLCQTVVWFLVSIDKIHCWMEYFITLGKQKGRKKQNGSV